MVRRTPDEATTNQVSPYAGGMFDLMLKCSRHPRTSIRRQEMSGIVTLICYVLFGTIVVVGLGVYLQLRQQARAEQQNKSGDGNSPPG